MAYVEGFVIAVPKANKERYRALAAMAGPIYKEYGALGVVENWADDVPKGKLTDFYMAVKCTDEETVVFSWIVWPDKATRDLANPKIYNDPRKQMPPDPPVFDGKRRLLGGFETIYEI